MKSISRRKFLEQSALASSALLMPSFVASMASTINGTPTDRRLVIIHLFGGNDGLNTIVPYRNDIYYNARKKISVKPKTILKINDEIGFNPAFNPIYDLYQSGKMCIINGVGYPNPEFSHFKSAQVWYKGTEQKFSHTGWLGRYLDIIEPTRLNPHKVVLFNDSVSLAITGKKNIGITINNSILNSGVIQSNQGIRSFIESYAESTSTNDYTDFIYQTARTAYQSFDYLRERNLEKKSALTYPDIFFGDNLKTIAGLIRGNADTRVFYTMLSGFDTHTSQSSQHDKLLKLFSSTLKTFVQDLEKDNLFDKTLIMVFSEFGRSLFENTSGGTDHGTANSVYLLNGKLKKAGIYNKYPSLISNENYYEHYVDFRSIYATVLKNWLNVDDKQILHKSYPILDFV